jgi:hypothetical protein
MFSPNEAVAIRAAHVLEPNPPGTPGCSTGMNLKPRSDHAMRTAVLKLHIPRPGDHAGREITVLRLARSGVYPAAAG